MTVRKIAVLFAAALAVTGCADDGAAPDGADGRAALAAALGGVEGGNYTFTRAGFAAAEGSVELPGSFLIEQEYGPSVLRAGDAYHLRYRIHGDAHDQWAKLLAEPAAGVKPAELKAAQTVMKHLDGEQWVRADEKRLRAAAAAEDISGMENLPASPTTAAPDVTGASALVGAVVDASKDGSTVTGTLDATTVDPELRLFHNDPYYFYGPKAKAVPFEATLDDQGRLTRIAVRVPGMLEAPASVDPQAFPSAAPTSEPNPELVIAISLYGGTAAQAAPDAPVLVDDAYEALTNDTD